MGPKILALLFLCVGAHGSVIKETLQLASGLAGFSSTGQLPTSLQFALRSFQLPSFLSADAVTLNDAETCYLCEVLVNAIIQERRRGMTDVQISAEASYFCEVLGIEDHRVCNGVVESNVRIFTYIIDNNDHLTGSKVCALLLQDNECNRHNDYEWTIEIPEGQTVEKAKATGSTSFNILHISDIHYDPNYTPGKTDQCGEPLCCQSDQEDAEGESDSCGFWGDYVNADVPLITITKTVDQALSHNPDFVYYTGDTVDHRVWDTSVSFNTEAITRISDLFHDHFTVPVYPVLGNHEAHPTNVFSSEGETDETISTQWLFDLIADKWGDWLTEDAKITIARGGYYTVSPKPGFRVIALNSNLCYIENWWLINEDKDPYDQLAWLVQTLLEAENNQESVHILMHIPTAHSDCLRTWSREYNRIVQRFVNTIVGQFNGHTHKDEFLVYYNSDSTEAISVAWNGASVTTLSNSNPSYKVYEVDGKTFDVLDYEEWTFNLTLANSDPNPNPDQQLEWYKLYSFKDVYGVDSLEPSAINDLLQRMAKNHSLIETYYNYKYRNSPYVLINPCDETCHKDILCDITTTVHGDTKQCEQLSILYDENTGSTSDSESNSGSDLQSDSGSDSEPDSEPDSGSDSQSDSGPGSEPESEPDSGSDSQSDSGSGSEPDSESDSGSDSQSDSGSGSEPDSESDSGSDSQSDSGSGSEPDSESDSGSDSQSDSGSGSEPDSESDSGSDLQSNPESGSGSDSESGSKSDSESNPESDSQLNS